MSQHAGQSLAPHGHESSVSLFQSQNFLNKDGHFSEKNHRWEWLASSQHHSTQDHGSLSKTLIEVFFKKGLEHARNEAREESSHHIVPIRGTLVLSGSGHHGHGPMVHVFATSPAPIRNRTQLHYARITFDVAKDDSHQISRWCNAVQADIELITSDDIHSVPPNAFDLKLETVPPEHRPDLMAFLNLHDRHTEPHAVEEQLGSLELGADTAWLDSDDDSVLSGDDNDDHAQLEPGNTHRTRKKRFTSSQYVLLKDNYTDNSIPDPTSQHFRMLLEDLQAKQTSGTPCTEAQVLEYYKNR